MKTTLEILMAARRRIEKPESWTQRAYQRDKNGNSLSVWDAQDATCWCARGAIWSIDPKGKLTDAFKALELAVPEQTVTVFNDTHTHAEVLAAFDRAIAAEEARQ